MMDRGELLPDRDQSHRLGELDPLVDGEVLAMVALDGVGVIEG